MEVVSEKVANTGLMTETVNREVVKAKPLEQEGKI